MDNSDLYRKEFDLIFQEIEEKERLQRQAESEPRAEFILRLLSNKSMQNLLASVPVAQKKEIIDTCVLHWENRLFPDKSSANM